MEQNAHVLNHLTRETSPYKRSIQSSNHCRNFGPNESTYHLVSVVQQWIPARFLKILVQICFTVMIAYLIQNTGKPHTHISHL